MTTEKIDGTYSLKKAVIMVFPNLLEPRAVQVKGKPSGDPKFSGDFLFAPDSEDLAAIKAKIAAIAKAKWPHRPFSELKFCIEDGNARIKRQEAKGKKYPKEAAGKVILSAKSKNQPMLGEWKDGRPAAFETPTAILAAKHKFYSGVYAGAEFVFAPYDGVGENKDGVTAYLQKVVTTGRGTRIAGAGTTMEEAFKGFQGGVSADDPMAGSGESLGDEIPF